MHVFFSGIGGSAIGPLALLAQHVGYSVSGSDAKESAMTNHLRSKGINDIIIGQSSEKISKVHSAKPIEWYVYSSAVSREPEGQGELQFIKDNGITHSKRDEFINKILSDCSQNLIAVAGTHGKTTTTAMLIWLFKSLDIPVSYLLGGKISFGEPGEFNEEAQYFVYEADEYDRNFLSFHPTLSVIPGVAYDHPDIYPTEKDYNEAFLEFFNQSKNVIAHPEDMERVTSISGSGAVDELGILEKITIPGIVNRKNAQLAIEAVYRLQLSDDVSKLVKLVNEFPGVARRFEKIAPNIYTDYAHTPEKIQGALQLAFEVNDSVVVVYEGLHNNRQHFIQKELKTLFSHVKKLYIVPSYRAREDESLEDLTPQKLVRIVAAPDDREPAFLNAQLKSCITDHAKSGSLVLCLTAGGSGSLDDWLRKEF